MYHFKVLHPTIRNNLPQMEHVQPPFIAGGNQIAYHLGLRGNNSTSTNQMPIHASEWSATQRILASKASRR